MAFDRNRRGSDRARAVEATTQASAPEEASPGTGEKSRYAKEIERSIAGLRSTMARPRWTPRAACRPSP